MFARHTPILFATTVVLALSVLAVTAKDIFNPTPTLVEEARAALGVEPRRVILSGQFVYVLGANAGGNSVIELRDATTLALIDSRAVDVVIEDLIADPDGSALYAIGTNGTETRFQVLDPKLGALGGVTVPRIGHPSLTIGADKLVAVSGIRTEFADGFFAAVNVRAPRKPALREDFYAGDARRGVLNGWLDPQFGAMFLNVSWDSRLLAVAAGKSYLMSEFRVETASGSLSEPYAITAKLGPNTCRQDQSASFLVADMSRNVLSLVDFDEGFQSLDVLSFVEFDLAPTRAILGRLEGTNMREPSGLVSAACDQSVIFVGSKTSTEVAQFARNDALNTLERVGTLRLPGRPSDLAVAASGDFAVAVSAENRAIIRFGNAADGGTGTRIIGNADVRELQRTLTEIGFPVGSIDGIIGEKTLWALDLAERRLGVDLNPNQNAAELVQILETALQRK